jgi:hypothetical protein
MPEKGILFSAQETMLDAVTHAAFELGRLGFKLYATQVQHNQQQLQLMRISIAALIGTALCDYKQLHSAVRESDCNVCFIDCHTSGNLFFLNFYIFYFY